MKRLLSMLGIAGLLAGCGGTAAHTADTPTTSQHLVKTTSKPKPQTFGVRGSLTVPIDITSVIHAKSPTIGVTPCRAGDGYNDIHAGAQVTVRDASGKVVALGQLDSGLLAGKPGTMLLLSKCSFAFAVEGVPDGGRFYSVEVAHRGELNYSASKMKSQLRLTLGS